LPLLKQLAALTTILGLVLTPAVFGPVLFATSPPRSHSVDVGDRAPDFELQDLGGKTVRLSDFRSNIVILNFWATWCVPCRKEIPLFLEMKKKYQDQGLSLIGIDTDDIDNETVATFVREEKMDYTILLGSDEVSAKYLSLAKLPVTIVIGPNGTISKKIMGAVTRAEIEAAIQSLLPPD